MITNDNDLTELINKTYDNVIVYRNKFNEICVKVDNQKYCSFYFKHFEKQNFSNSVAEKFINHNCLSLSFQYSSSYGGGYMETCDNQDLSNKIIEMIDTHIKLDKRRYEQLSLF